MKTITAADLYCGAGGTSAGLADVCNELDYKLELIAVNHWDVAIASHTANHPYATHYCQSVDNMNPREVVPGGRLRILVASPECIFHSNARGGRPINDQRRASAWHILRWAEALYIDAILVENVPEFEMWGPLTASGHRIKRLKGQTFLAFIEALRSLGYHVEYRTLRAADYGDPTTRERLFVLARRNRKVQWPEQTHSREVSTDLFGNTMKKWVAAKEIIDWGLRGQSVFDRKRPLAESTVQRIMAGLRKFGGKHAEPFIVTLRNHCDAQSIDKPLPTVTAGGNHFGLVEPFILQQQSGGAPRSTREPLPTVATKGAIALVQPFLMNVAHGDGDNGRHRSVNEPLPTVTTKNGLGLVQPYITKYYGTAKSASSIDEPLDTITTKERFGLVVPQHHGRKVDILFRMLQPHELAAAQSLGHFKFTGTKSEVTAQIGNAVPRKLASALVRSLLT